MSWTRPADVRALLQKRWARGDILADSGAFPMRISLRGPDAKELSSRFEEVRAWIEELRGIRHGRLEMRETNNRILGRNQVPCAVIVESPLEAVDWLDKRREYQAYRRLLDETQEREPALLEWLTRRPHRALELRAEWSRLLDVVAWMKSHPKPAIYLRQVDLPGIHTKFIEAHRGVLSELLEPLLPATDPTASGVAHFARRYGFLARPERVRLRVLDPAIRLVHASHGAQDLTLDVETFATLQCGAKRVFMTENEMNFLAFPAVPESVVLFGAGYGFSALTAARWLQDCRLLYSGDLDTHGFAILNQLRAVCPHAESFMMDRSTLLAFEAQWGHEDTPTQADLPLLTATEAALYDDLRWNRIRVNLRLEQERIGYQWVSACVLASATSPQ